MSLQQARFCLVIVFTFPYGFQLYVAADAADLGYAGIFSFVFRAHSLAPAKFRGRRFLALIGDLGAQSLLIHLGDEILHLLPAVAVDGLPQRLRFGLNL